MQRYQISIAHAVSTHHIARVALTFVPRIGDTLRVFVGEPKKGINLLVTEVLIIASEQADEAIQLFVTYKK